MRKLGRNNLHYHGAAMIRDWCFFDSTNEPRMFRCVACGESIQPHGDGPPNVRRRCKAFLRGRAAVANHHWDVALHSGWYTLVAWLIPGRFAFVHTDERGASYRILAWREAGRWRLSVEAPEGSANYSSGAVAADFSRAIELGRDDGAIGELPESLRLEPVL
jgi:hypothetical protein